MDERSLRELELLPVARLYGLATQAAVGSASGAAAIAPVPPAEAEALRTVLASRGDDAERWAFVVDALEGHAATLLDNMLRAVGCRRGAEERFAARDLKRHAPKVIVALGHAAAARLLEAEADLPSLRGQVHRYDALPVVVTFAPEYLLGHAAEKARAWEDLLLARTTASGD